LIERHNLKRAKAVIAISRRVKQEVLKNYPFVDAGQVYVIYSGVNLQEFHPRHRKKALAIRRRFAISPDEKLLLFVGNPFGRKGLESLIRALPLLRSREYVLLVSGNDGPTPYEKLAEKLGVADRIRWNIGLTYAINQFFAASDIFVLPTRYEPFGLVILEAMASGLPPITSRIAGAAELIEDGKEGFLIKNPHNEREIANKIDRLLSDESLLVRMRKRCRKKAETYPWFRTAQLMLQVFEQVS
jgi:UDP-glucose:(heptosyl)LPS alpha-1,3-glucosyltransferase